MVLCEIKHVTVRYGDDVALQHIDFTVNEGQFITVAGMTGSGKSTLLSILKGDVLSATVEGSCLFQGKPLHNAPKHAISYVMQNPREQLVMEKVWQELAFPLENMQVPTVQMEQRIAEVLQYLGIPHLFDAPTHTLSGGQQQLVSLAVALVQRPHLLLLDEPTAQLDPLAATHFLQLLGRIHRELGLTIVIVEHRLEELLPMSDRLVVIEQKQIAYNGTPQAVVKALKQHRLLHACGAAAFMSAHCPTLPFALSVLQARQTFPRITATLNAPTARIGNVSLQGSDIYFRYTRQGADVLRGASVTLFESQVLAIVGGNGSGKSTLLHVLASLKKAYKGRVVATSKQRVAYLSQQPSAFFSKQSVAEELASIESVAAEGYKMRYDYICELFQLQPIFAQHPASLSGGQQQLVAFAKIFCLGAAITLLDEPTKGLDPHAKSVVGQAILQMRVQQMSILVVTHDVDFAAHYATHCAMLFQGKLTPTQTVHDFFSMNRFYTTSARRIAYGSIDGVITNEELLETYRGQYID